MRDEEVLPEKTEMLILAATMVLCYFFVWFTGRMQSKYGLIFLLPILSGSTRYPLRGARLVTLIAVILYGSFFFTDKNVPLEELPEETLELAIIIFFSALIGLLVNNASEQERVSQRKLRRAAEDITAANVELRLAQEDLRAKVVELETMEQAIRRADRLAALGEMSSGLAHEIRSPLGVIQSSAEMLEKKVLSLEPDNRLVSVIVEEISRINKLIEYFLAFASPPSLQLQTTNLNEILQRAIHLVEAMAKSRQIRIEVNSSYNYTLQVDENLLHQCLLNLLLNALDVTPFGGTIRVEAVFTRSENEIRIAIRDSGPGIPADAESRIFIPFYTTKENGTGLGLAIVQQIMTMHAGRIEVENSPDGGAVFILCLPLQESEVVPSELKRGGEEAHS
jgi:signal transduction histidine kinase